LYAPENQEFGKSSTNNTKMVPRTIGKSPVLKFPTFLFALVLPLFFMVGCSGSDQKKAPAESGKELVASLDRLFEELSTEDTNSSELSEEVVQLNEKIRRTIENIRPTGQLSEIAESYSKDAHGFSFTLSQDKKLGIFSWHTKMDASGNKIKNMALYDQGDRLEVSSLLSAPIIFEKIHQVESYKGQVLYVLQGKDDTGVGNFFRLDAYTLRDGLLEEAPAFPNNESSISIAQMDQETDPSVPLGFKVVMNGSRILIPEIQGDANEAQSLAFNGKKYVPEDQLDE